jgi:transposase-like protein
MRIIRRQYTTKEKEKIIPALLSGESALNLGREHNISPGFTNRWERQ